MKRNILRTAILAALFCLITLPAHALLYYFNTANEIGAWTGDPTTGYGSVEITTTSENFIKFEIKANTDYFTTDSSEKSGLTWDQFHFNFNPDKTLNLSAIVINADGSWTIDEDRNISSFGIFNYSEYGTGPNFPMMLNPLEFTIEDPSLDVLDFVYPNLDGNYYAGHLRRFGDGNEDSIYLTVAPVPEPGTLILIGSGLGGLLLYRKRRAT